jgi:site-specific DNA recombinase
MIMRGKGKKGDLYFYYICRGRQDHTCDLPYVPVATAEDAVERYYATVALPADLRARVSEAMDNAITEESVTTGGRRDQLKKQLAKLDVQEDQFIDLVGDPDWPKEKISARLRRIRDQRARLQRQLDQTERPDLDTGRATLRMLLDLLARPHELYRLAGKQSPPRAQPSHLHAPLPRRGRARPTRHVRRANHAVRAAHARAQGRTAKRRCRCPPGQRHRRRR